MMKKAHISFIAILLFLASCQKKQYATVQQNNINTFEYSKKYRSNIESDDAINPKTIILSENKSYEPNETLNLVAINSDIPQQKDELKYDERKINATFKELNKLEQYINTKDEKSIEEMQNEDFVTAFNLDKNTTTSITKEGELPLNIPAFVWGCMLGWIGILLVYILTDDKEQTKKALYGCLVTGGVVVVVYAIIVIAAINQSY